MSRPQHPQLDFLARNVRSGPSAHPVPSARLPPHIRPHQPASRSRRSTFVAEHMLGRTLTDVRGSSGAKNAGTRPRPSIKLARAGRDTALRPLHRYRKCGPQRRPPGTRSASGSADNFASRCERWPWPRSTLGARSAEARVARIIRPSRGRTGRLVPAQR